MHLKRSMRATSCTLLAWLVMGTICLAATGDGSFQFTGVVVARSAWACSGSKNELLRCSEYYLVAPAPAVVLGEAGRFLVILREFSGNDPDPDDVFLEDRDLTLITERDAICDRTVTYKQTGWSCGDA